MDEMDGTQRPVDHQLNIPRLDSSRRRTITIAVGILLLAVGAAAYFLTRDSKQSPYRVVPVARTTVVKELRVTGHLELTDQVEVPAMVEGQLVKVFVRPGDSVEEGQLLAQLDKGSAQTALDVAQAELQAARARVAEAEAAAKGAAETFERTKRLSRKSLASDSTLEMARTDLGKARALLQAARADRTAAQNRASIRGRERERTDIVAPRAGLVLEVPPHTGMIVGPKNRLFRIGASVDQMKIVAPIGEADIGEVTVGLDAKFEVPTYPGRLFDAMVKHLSPDPRTEYGAIFYDVEFATENPDHLLLPGMTAHLRIEIAQVDGVLVVREATLRFTPEGAPPAPPRSRLWRVRGEVLEEIPVEVGLSDGALTEIRPSEPGALDIDDPIAIGLALDGEGDADSPLLSLRGRR